MRNLFRTAWSRELTSYHALYIELALTEMLPLATLDKRLREGL